MKLMEYADREMLAMDLAGKIASELKLALGRSERVSLCLSGGGTPGPVYDTLSGIALDWERVDVFLNDERWVGEDHPRSNTAMLRDRLLRDRAAAARLVPMHAPVETPEEALETLAAGLRPCLPIDVLLLGMGDDGHTASMFPGGDRLEEALAPNAPILLPIRAEGAEEPRITLSAPVLRGAGRTHIIITGPEKRALIEAAQGADPRRLPVAAVLADAVVHWAA